MCGIVGLFLKDKALEPKLGEMLSEMLVSLSDRGPDSAGIAIYGAGEKKKSKITIQSADPDVHDNALEFLDNVLPPALRARVVPLFDRAVSPTERARAKASRRMASRV